ncbi:jg23663 [Pararge aegeria aegeria]|uniref:Jg23663 protein n=1 Tax=Pararge aegeria aegeria TaxID=348720 RepID=A0A8S4SKR1_9NEOP|nr:jg23663 [Pararge aegeria aegeria]
MTKYHPKVTGESHRKINVTSDFYLIFDLRSCREVWKYSSIRPCSGQYLGTYGAECWVLSNKDENSLLIFERKVLRRVFGAMQDNGFWRILYNHELYELFKEPNVVKTIKLLRMLWAGHVQSMGGTRAPKRLMEGTLEGRRGRGRPRGRWSDGVERDMRVLGVLSSKKAASDRLKWRNMLDQANAHPGL